MLGSVRRRLWLSTYRLLEPVWKLLPNGFRDRILLVTQSTFTVGVSAVLTDAEGRILLLRNRFRYSSAWQIPGGFVDRGEELEESITREIREETGLVVEVVSLLAARLARTTHLDVCFLCRIRGGQLQVDDSEILEARFFCPEELPPGVPPDQLESIRHALRAGLT